MRPMRLLIFGAGVLGTFYAAKLQACGHDVTVLARGRRAVQVRDYGLVVQERGRGCLRARASVIETLRPDQSYDYVLVLVRNDQIESVLPSLAANKATPSLVFMFNNLAGPQRLIDVLGRERVVLGFPGAAGERASDGTVIATVLPALIQKTTSRRTRRPPHTAGSAARGCVARGRLSHRHLEQHGRLAEDPRRAREPDCGCVLRSRR